MTHMFVNRQLALGLMVAACAQPKVGPSASIAKPAEAKPPLSCEYMSEQFSRTLKQPVIVDVYGTRGVAESEAFLERIQPVLVRDRIASSRLLEFEV